MYVRKEVHFNLFRSGTFTGFTPSTLGIKAEPTNVIAPLLCFKTSCEYFANERKNPRIRGDIRMRRSSDRRLIDDYCLFQLIQTSDGIMLPSTSGCAVKMEQGLLCENVHYEARFPRSGNAGDNGKSRKRQIRVDGFEIVFSRSANLNPTLELFYAVFPLNALFSRKVRSGIGIRILANIFV